MHLRMHISRILSCILIGQVGRYSFIHASIVPIVWPSFQAPPHFVFICDDCDDFQTLAIYSSTWWPVKVIVTHADSCHGRICLSLFLHDISKTDAARINKFDIEMFHNESWKTVYVGVKRSWVTKILPAWVFALLWVLASCSLLFYYLCHDLFIVSTTKHLYIIRLDGAKQIVLYWIGIIRNCCDVVTCATPCRPGAILPPPFPLHFPTFYSIF